jgi:hypothetical protein
MALEVSVVDECEAPARADVEARGAVTGLGHHPVIVPRSARPCTSAIWGTRKTALYQGLPAPQAISIPIARFRAG